MKIFWCNTVINYLCFTSGFHCCTALCSKPVSDFFFKVSVAYKYGVIDWGVLKWDHSHVCIFPITVCSWLWKWDNSELLNMSFILLSYCLWQEWYSSFFNVDVIKQPDQKQLWGGNNISGFYSEVCHWIKSRQYLKSGTWRQRFLQFHTA